MGFKNWLLESQEFEKIHKILLKDCSYYFSLLEKYRILARIFRGVWESYNPMKKLKVEKNRIPRNTNLVLHKILDEEFYKKFKWKPRSEGIFAQMGSSNGIEQYGNIHYLFPVGKFSVLGSPKIEDLFLYLQDEGFKVNKLDKIDEKTAEKYREFIKDQIILMYITDFKRLYYSNTEISINCNEYYLVNESIIKDNYFKIFNQDV